MRTVKTDQSGRMPRLIRVFAGHTCHFVGFVMRWLIYFVTGAIQEGGASPVSRSGVGQEG